MYETVDAVILAIDPAKGASGAAILRPDGKLPSLVTAGTVTSQSMRQSFVEGAVTASLEFKLPLVVVAEEWDKPRPGDQKWTYKTVLGMGEGWGWWTAEFDRYHVRDIVRVTPNTWRDALFGRKRAKDSAGLKEQALFYANGLYRQWHFETHDMAEAVCIGLWGYCAQSVHKATATAGKRRIKPTLI